MTRHRKTREEIVQSTMRIPRSLWERINKVADMKRLSMAQTVERALIFFCYVNGELPFDFDESSPLSEIEWRLALETMQTTEERRIEERRLEQKKRRGVKK